MQATITDACAAVGLFISGGGLIFSGLQSRYAAHATSISTVQHFILESRRLWDECDDAIRLNDSAKFKKIVGDIMGHFEVVSTLVAEGAVSGRLCRLVTGTLRDYLDHMSQRGFTIYVQDALDTPEVCENLKDFCLQNRRGFRHAEAVYEMMRLPRASL